MKSIDAEIRIAAMRGGFLSPTFAHNCSHRITMPYVEMTRHGQPKQYR
jgi:hypothetical protein